MPTSQDNTPLLFGVRAEFDEPAVIEWPLDQDELRRFVHTSFGDHN